MILFDTFVDENQMKLIAVDGTVSRDSDHKLRTNLCLFNINNKVPIYIESIDGRNQETKMFESHVRENIDSYKGHVFVCDRFYFSYKLMKFLNDNDIKFIIRGKSNLLFSDDEHTELTDSVNVNNLKEYARIISFDRNIKMHVDATSGKNNTDNPGYDVNMKTDISIVTNVDEEDCSDDDICDIYGSRWSIESYFKDIKATNKIANNKEKNINAQYEKNFCCSMIVTYVAKIIIAAAKASGLYDYKKTEYQFNQKNIVEGLYSEGFREMVLGNYDKDRMLNFIEAYCVTIRNKKDRSFPRVSKTPFTKWYVKDYSAKTGMLRIIKAIINHNTQSLNKNEKVIANRIMYINVNKKRVYTKRGKVR